MENAMNTAKICTLLAACLYASTVSGAFTPRTSQTFGKYLGDLSDKDAVHALLAHCDLTHCSPLQIRAYWKLLERTDVQRCAIPLPILESIRNAFHPLCAGIAAESFCGATHQRAIRLLRLLTPQQLLNKALEYEHDAQRQATSQPSYNAVINDTFVLDTCTNLLLDETASDATV